MRYCLIFSTKNDFLCLFFWMYKTHFPLAGPSIYSAMSLFSSRVDELLLWITENKDVSSVNSFVFEDNPDKSLMYIKKQ